MNILNLVNYLRVNYSPANYLLAKKIIFLFTLINILFSTNYVICRSRLRKSHEKKPRIIVCRDKTTREHKHRKTKSGEPKIKTIKPKEYFIASNQLLAESIFKTFDKEFFYNNMLPETISYRYDKTKSVTKEELSKKLENLILEVKKKKRIYTDFKILKQSDFNRRNKSGILILKFKDYPFVVKMFIENPKSFVKPYSKGVIPIFIWMMNSMNRHLLGFTRIKNLQDIKEKILKNPKWSKRIEFPRKWHWVPKDPKNIKIVGKNFDINNTKLETVIPGIYCIIADAIKLKPNKASLREECMSLCNFLNVCIDPHIDNFMLEEGTDKIALIDTENFREVVGLKGKQEFSGYVSWIYNVGTKCIGDMLFRPKRRHRSQLRDSSH